MLERVQKRLAGWKGMHLSKGGRVVLAKSVLASLPTYYLSLFVIPILVANRIERCQRDFIWGKRNLKEGIHLVAWDDMCKSRKKDGLGIVKMRVMNKALLSKWLWRFGKEENSLWRQVIASKYGLQNAWESKNPSQIPILWNELLERYNAPYGPVQGSCQN